MKNFNKKRVPKPSIAPPDGLLASSTRKELEIGAGDGEFALQRARNHPDLHFIAIEKSRTLFRRMEKRCQKYSLSNLWIFHTNAVWWITHFVPEKSLHKIYILYPNIYIKPRQKNLRWCNRPFMSYLLSRLEVGGTLEIRTNHKAYYEETKQKMLLYSEIQNSQDLQLNLMSSVSSGTAFERKYLARKEPCWALIYKKIV